MIYTCFAHTYSRRRCSTNICYLPNIDTRDTYGSNTHTQDADVYDSCFINMEDIGTSNTHAPICNTYMCVVTCLHMFGYDCTQV